MRSASRPDAGVHISLILIGLAALLAGPLAAAVETERLYLSGTGFDDTVDWEFFCTGGRRSGEWAKIPVPSQWELHGFGHYNYGHDERKHDEQGLYRHRFKVPEAWQGRRVDLVFEGVMTDAEVTIDGRSVGPKHQGAFYRFRYDVTQLVTPGGENLLEVTVSKNSSNRSVNLAERDADYWVFGGIYRPVYLESAPAESIERVTFDARHDGSLKIHAFLRGLVGPGLDMPAKVRVLVIPIADGPVSPTPVADLVSDEIAPGIDQVRLETSISGVNPWSAESPSLYRALIELHRGEDVNGRQSADLSTPLHRLEERFGFRTVEVRPGEGLFVNDTRVLLKGVNRHVFWPTSGRTSSPRLDRRDAELIKSLNMNAVRMSHYPPDPSFLDACDEIGLYVIDELAGWHDAYDTKVGRKLVREMVVRDVNHPSILLWANGNEGGWNTRLDKEFGRWDPQGRPVIYPHDVAGGLDTTHYLDWDELTTKLNPDTLRNRWRRRFGGIPPFLPTEILHGLYDGGSGAGLEDYWGLLRSSPLAAGAFLWSFVDESVVRTDRGGALDSDGNHAPDGVFGPYRERTGNFYAVRESFAPIAFLDPPETIFQGRMAIENRFDMINLSSCRVRWTLLDFPAAGEAPDVVTLNSGEVTAPDLAPGRQRDLILPIDRRDADAVSVIVRDPYGHAVARRVMPVRDLRRDVDAFTKVDDDETVRVAAQTDDEHIVLTTDSVVATIDRETGELRSLAQGETSLALEGPKVTDSAAPTAATVRRFGDGAAEAVEVDTGDGPPRLRWDLHPSGWLRLRYAVTATGRRDFFGVYFPWDAEDFHGLQWLGHGPARVWRNRLQGGALGHWAKGRSTPPESSAEPKLEGFYAGVVWAEIETGSGRLLIAIENDGSYLGVASPIFPEDSKTALAAETPSGIGFYHEIPAIGTKFKEAATLGPQSEPSTDEVFYQGSIWLRIVEP